MAPAEQDLFGRTARDDAVLRRERHAEQDQRHNERCCEWWSWNYFYLGLVILALAMWVAAMAISGRPERMAIEFWVSVGCLSVVVVALVGLYEICEHWLVPWLRQIQGLTGMSDDLAGCTIMAFGSAMPEIAISTVAVLEGDTRISLAVVCGSAIFSFGAIPALCYFSIDRDMELRRWPIVRDTCFYFVALGVVTYLIFSGGESAGWFDALLLLLIYAVYICVVVWAPSVLPELAGTLDRPRTRADSGDERRGDAADRGTPGEAAPLVGAAEGPSNSGGEDRSGDFEASADRGSGNCCLRANCLLWLLTDVVGVAWRTLYAYTNLEPPPILRGKAGAAKMAAAQASPVRTAGGALLAFLWLVALSEGIYYAVLLNCSYVPYLDQASLGGVLIAAGTSMPCLAGAVAMTRVGMHEGAISNAISCQVIIVTLAFAVPWFLYIWTEHHQLDLKTSVGGRRMEGILVGLTVLTASVFLYATMAPGFTPVHKGAGIVHAGATLMVTVFALSYAAFIVIEILYELGYIN